MRLFSWVAVSEVLDGWTRCRVIEVDVKGRAKGLRAEEGRMPYKLRTRASRARGARRRMADEARIRGSPSADATVLRFGGSRDRRMRSHFQLLCQCS